MDCRVPSPLKLRRGCLARSAAEALAKAASPAMTTYYNPHQPSLAQRLYCVEKLERDPASARRNTLMSADIHPVDQVLPLPRLLALGLQHVLVMYAGAVAVPLIIGRALKLPPEDVAFL